MKTTNKKYIIRIHFPNPVPGIAENGVLVFPVRCKSPQGAEKEARNHAKICRTLAAPTFAEIEYNTQAGTKIRRIDFTEDAVACDRCTDKGHCPEYVPGAPCVKDRAEGKQHGNV